MLAVFIYIILLNSGNFLYLLTKSQKHLLEWFFLIFKWLKESNREEWIGTEPAKVGIECLVKEASMNPMFSQLASIHFFLIMLLISGAFAFLRIVKNLLEV